MHTNRQVHQGYHFPGREPSQHFSPQLDTRTGPLKPSHDQHLLLIYLQIQDQKIIFIGIFFFILINFEIC
jgi:hypothetical protein